MTFSDASASRRGSAPDLRSGFAAFLVDESALDALAVERARRAAESTGDALDRVLTKLGLIPETELASLAARFLGLRRFMSDRLPPEPPEISCLTPSFLRSCRMLPLSFDQSCAVFATDQPFEHDAVKAIGYALDRSIEVVVATPGEWDRAFEVSYGAEGLRVGEAPQAIANDDDLDIHRLRDIASEGPIIRLVGQVIMAAVEERASDIHVDPAVDQVVVRYRVDGVLRVARTIPAALKAAVISRIKIMARLDIAERRLPQDGRMQVAVRGVDIDFRVATIPTAYGESVVLRILDRSSVVLDLDKLGFDRATIDGIRSLMRRPNGIVLVTGPTGSGKTTTLYTAIQEIDAESLKIITVEDPIEYQLAGLTQVQVQPQIGLSFPAVLRSVLRHNPNVILIGEIRDLETARIAIQASLTGHLVLSTIHANSAVATVARLVDMGVEDHLLASTLRGILAQRLVRRLCACAGEHRDAAQWRDRLMAPRDAKVLEAKGCASCGGSGYRGRMTISELLVLREGMSRLLVGQGGVDALASAARAAGMRSMYDSGLSAVFAGLTTIEEVLAAVQDE